MEFIQMLLFYITLFFLTIIYFTLYSKKSTINHGFKNYPILGTIPHLISNRHRFLEWTTETLSVLPTHTAVFYRPIGVNHGVFTADPANVEYILRTNFINYPKGPRFVSILHDFLGTGIFNSDGPVWQLQRKTASFAFTMRILRNFLMKTVQTEIKTHLDPLLNEAAGSNRVLDLQDVLERFAFDNVCKLAFNFDPVCLNRSGSVESEFMKAFDEATALSSARFLYAFPVCWKIKKLFNFGSEKKLRDAIRTVHEFADEIIRSRLIEEERSENNNCEKNEDLLSRFIVTSKNNAKLLRDVVISVILAGKDTTSTGLSWFFWLLSKNPEVTEKIRFEVGQIRARYKKQVKDTFEYEELNEMHYLHGAISESLRLYPPVPVDTKACLENDILPDGSRVKKGWFVLYHTYAMGRMESIWGKDCLEFKPERWLVNGLYKPKSPFSFPVFHGGPRVCLGREMAYIQMKSIVASVIEKYEVNLVRKECPNYLLSLTLRIKDGLHVTLKERVV
ncbi:hypothetical protein RND81_05G181700 [Saponaria officinalis]|uniref:Cytochrome P450 n=1 Tax=Saponaria officinalis TaxID=3572 RepID=A0AAW1KZQ2_SAPOF